MTNNFLNKIVKLSSFDSMSKEFNQRIKNLYKMSHEELQHNDVKTDLIKLIMG